MAQSNAQGLGRRAQILWLQSTASPHFGRIVLVALLQLLSTFLYSKSLAGGPIDWVKEHLFELGVHLILSIVLFCVAVLVAVGLSTRRSRVLVLTAQVIILALQFVADRGDNFKQHGSYNALLFFIISFLILSISLSIMLCYSLVKQKDVFWKVLIVAVIVIVVLTWWRLSVYRELWGHGLLGKQLDRTTPGMCSFESRGNLPFIDLLPAGAQNFWTGAQTCPKQAFAIDAEIDATGVLTIRCKKEQGAAKYTFLPNTIPMSTEQKRQSKLPRVVKKLSVRHDYAKPFLLPEDQESVLVHCGDVTELRTNLQVSKRIRAHLNEVSSRPKSQVGKQTTRNTERPVNVLVLFFDAVGRRQLIRRLPKTMEVLENLHSPSNDAPLKKNKETTDDRDGSRLFQFFRYHVLGFNTDPNTRALYTGDTALNNESRSIAEDVFEGKFDQEGRQNKTRFMVARAETNCEDWAAQYSERAASQNSFDHEFIAPMCDESYFSHDGHPFGNFRGPYSVKRRCLHDKYVHTHTLDYLRSLEERYRTHAPEVPWLMYGSFIEGHEGTGEVLSTVDEDLASFLLHLAADGVFKDTALFIVADHGLHMGLNFVYTMNGVIEHASPALVALLPQRHLTQEMASNLEHNEQALVTAYNIHHTWRDILGLQDTDSQQSLLRTKIKLDAKCNDVGISQRLCQCK